jgi:hypothetical protein
MGARFRAEDISAPLPDNAGAKDFAREKHAKAPEGATTEAATGAVAAGALGVLAGVGAGAVAGGLVGALIGTRIPEYEAKRYEGMIKEGRALLSVRCDNSDWVKRAKGVLQNTGLGTFHRSANTDRTRKAIRQACGAECDSYFTTQAPRHGKTP